VLVPAYRTVSYDVPFVAGQPAFITTSGRGTSVVELTVYDGDGNVFFGNGFGDRKSVGLSVYRSGVFRIEVRNPGPMANRIVISTN
jgi:hypothetical protein